MLHVYRLLIRLRNEEKTLQYGVYKNLDCKNDCISFTRVYEKTEITVIINFGAARKVKLPRKAKKLLGTTDLQTNRFLIYRLNNAK